MYVTASLDTFELLIANTDFAKVESLLRAHLRSGYHNTTPHELTDNDSIKWGPLLVGAAMFTVTVTPEAKADVDRIDAFLWSWVRTGRVAMGTLIHFIRIPGPRPKRESAIGALILGMRISHDNAEPLVDAIIAAVREDLELHPTERRLT